MSELKEHSYPDHSLGVSEDWVTQSKDSLTFNKETLQQIKSGLDCANSS